MSCDKAIYGFSGNFFLRTASGNGWDNICGGIVGFSKIHAYVAKNCSVKKHILKEPQLLLDRVYICTPQAGGKRTVYLHLSVAVNEVNRDFLMSLLIQEQTVDVWSSLLSRLPSLDKIGKDQGKLVASIGQSTLREDFLTPHKKQKRVVKALSDNKLAF